MHDSFVSALGQELNWRQVLILFGGWRGSETRSVAKCLNLVSRKMLRNWP